MVIAGEQRSADRFLISVQWLQHVGDMAGVLRLAIACSDSSIATPAVKVCEQRAARRINRSQAVRMVSPEKWILSTAPSPDVRQR
jgi:hypothetical protein